MRAYQLPKGGAGIDALVEIEHPDAKPPYRQILVNVKSAISTLRAAAIACRCARTSSRENPVTFIVGEGFQGRTRTKLPWAAAATACSRTTPFWRKTAGSLCPAPR